MLSDALGDLAAEPAGAQLAELAGRVERVDPDALVRLGEQVRRAGEGLDGSVRALDRGRSAIGHGWRGPGADAAGRWLDGFGRAGGQTREATGRAAAELVAVGRALAEVRDEVARQAASALAAARAARARVVMVGGDRIAADRAAADATAGPTATARAAVERAEEELARAAGALGGLAGGMTAFAGLPVPGGPVGGSGTSADRASSGTTEPIRRRTIDPHGQDGGSGSVAGPRPGSGDLVESPDAGVTPPPSTGIGGPPGQVGDWIRQATAILASGGVPVDRMNPDDIATIIDRESGGDPAAVNGADGNAARGTPSQGLMQTIAPTFARYRLPGHGDIHDPVDNIIAGVRYAIARYGSVSRVPGIVALAKGHAYVGY